jgi:hypothetical protein
MPTRVPLGAGDPVERWQQQLADVAGDITALDDVDVYKELERGSVGKPPALSGETLRQAKPLVTTVHTLFQQYALLNERVSRAASARTSAPGWLPGHQSTALAQIERALGDPIDLGSNDLPVAPGVLLANMRPAIAAVQHDLEAFRVARDAAYGTLTSARGILTALARQAAGLGIGSLPALADVGERIEHMGRTAAADPLGMHASFQAEVLPILEQANRLVKAAQAARADLDVRLADAVDVLDRLTSAHRRATDGWQNAARKVLLDPTTLRAPVATPAQLADLSQWLDRLAAMVRGGSWREASGPLAAWSNVAQPLLVAESDVARINAGPLDQMEMLRGRLTVLRTVAQSNGLGLLGANPSPERAAANAAYRAAEQALMRPTPESRVDLAQAKLLVDRYAALVDPESLA